MRIMIVEDDTSLGKNLKFLIGGESEMEVCGLYPTAEEALESLEKDAPDLILADLGLPGISGVEFIRRVKEIHPEVLILAHTLHDDRKTVFSAIKTGAMGYLLKGTKPRELVEALEELYKGGAPMSPKIARAIISDFQSDKEKIEEQYLLSPRERTILKNIEQGLSYKEIATEQNISPHTVHTHIKHAYEKLHAANRKDALVKARIKGII